MRRTCLDWHCWSVVDWQSRPINLPVSLRLTQDSVILEEPGVVIWQFFRLVTDVHEKVSGGPQSIPEETGHDGTLVFSPSLSNQWLDRHSRLLPEQIFFVIVLVGRRYRHCRRVMCRLQRLLLASGDGTRHDGAPRGPVRILEGPFLMDCDGSSEFQFPLGRSEFSLITWTSLRYRRTLFENVL